MKTRTRRLTRLVPLALAMAWLPACHLQLEYAPTTIGPQRSALFVFSNSSEGDSPGEVFYLAVDVPLGWTFATGAWEASTAPFSGSLVPAADPGLPCRVDTGPDDVEPLPLPVPGTARRFFRLAGLSEATPESSGHGFIELLANSQTGSRDLAFYFISGVGSEGLCDGPQSATVEVRANHFFSDGFESGGLLGWS